jgi:putative transposase
VYHVTSRGDRREPIFVDDHDRHGLRDVVAQALFRFDAEILFQGRFKTILVDRDAYLLELCRYVELNPVRARLVKKPEAWAWSSYRAQVGLEDSAVWLDTDGLHGYLLGRTRKVA